TKGYSTDIDIISKDGEVHLFEIKFRPDQRDIYHFIQVSKLYQKKYKIKPSKLFLICIEINKKTLDYANNNGIEVIAGKIKNEEVSSS
ncbi:MAG: hypothetical protein ACTSO2_14560, partial [Promethearchaeota archaeon]